MTAIPRLTRLSSTLALLLAILIAAGLPAAYFVMSYQGRQVALETEAFMNSVLLSQAISHSPDFWQFEEHRLVETLAHHTSKDRSGMRCVIGPDGAVVARYGEADARPLLTVSHPLHEAGNTVGRIELTTSLRPILRKTLLVGALGLTLGLGVFLTLLFFPLRAVSTALRSVFEERERALAILNNVPDIAWLKDRESRYIAANGPFARTCGVAVGDLPGKTDLDLWPRQLAEHYRADDREVIESGRPKQIEEPIVDRDGNEIWISTVKTPIFSETGEVIGTAGIARDFTERRRIEEALREREEKLRSITEIASDAIVMMDHEGRISFWNPAAAGIFGYAAEEAVGRELHEMLAPRESREACRAGLEHFHKTGHGPAVGRLLELKALKKGGEELSIELSLSALQLAGRWHAVGVARDITRRKQAEQEALRRETAVSEANRALAALAASEQLYEGDIGSAFREITEASSRTIGVRRVSIWYYTGAKDGITCVDLYDAGAGTHSDGLTLGAADYPAYFRELREEYCIVAADAVTDPRTREFAEGYLKPLGITSMLDVPIRVNGRVIGVVCHEHVGPARAWSVEEQSFGTAIAGFAALAIEVRERKRAEERFAKLNEELEQKVRERTSQLLETQEELVRKEKLSILGQLAGSVGHELRNPLGVMSNAIYYLQMVQTDADPTIREYLDLIKHEIDNSQRIISDLLDYARTKTPQRQTISVGRLLESCLSTCAIPENVALRTDLPETLPHLRVDPLQVGQIFHNLLSNAIQAMPAGGTVRIGAGVAGCGEPTSPPGAERVEISVSDTGTGIAPENLGRLFQPLFTTKAKGIGLGLVVCKRLAEANGGTIGVESAPGVGTTFRVSLPTEGDRA